ncbi:hypothetical protein WR25_19454 [Diploscapter pachys]|uniref:Myb-like domain-containing protein n=1 Tax=Diploscapter pachys TaxID=2018661 RepID=A0A2A2KLB8_9BILA|nr:hypothetical protein WR25_19454 [Diploscapter pachys]
MSAQRRKLFTGKEELDTKKMKISDMIYWNPKNEAGMKKKDSDASSVVSAQRQDTSTSLEPKQPAIVAPQVKIGPDGKLVIDEASLVVQGTEKKDTSAWDIVEEDRMGSKITSMSFRKRLFRKGTSWTEKETELFYEILRHTGPDFGLMHEYFPTRARHELKTKFNREEKTNWARLNEVLKKPALLHDSLHDYVEKVTKEIEEDIKLKRDEKKAITRTTEYDYRKQRSSLENRQPAFEDPDNRTASYVQQPTSIPSESSAFAVPAVRASRSNSSTGPPQYADLKPMAVYPSNSEMNLNDSGDVEEVIIDE